MTIIIPIWVITILKIISGLFVLSLCLLGILFILTFGKIRW